MNTVKTVKEKLQIRDRKVCVLSAPAQYSEVESQVDYQEAEVLQVFLNHLDDLELFLEKKLSLICPEAILWLTYPKNSPKIGIHRDILAQRLRQYDWESVAICSIDDNWSALRFKKIS